MISRARKRPRDKSVSFRTFWWLLVHEAAVGVCVNTYAAVDNAALRRWIAPQPSYLVARHCGRLIARDRGRRYWP